MRKGNNLVNVLEHQILIVSGRVFKLCFLHNNIDADCKCIYYVIYDVITVDYCEYILLYSPLNPYLCVDCILDFK